MSKKVIKNEDLEDSGNDNALSKKELYDLKKKERLKEKKKRDKKNKKKIKGKKKHNNLGAKIFAVLMLLLMVGSVIVSVFYYFTN